MLTFGRAPTFQTSDAIDFAVSEDGRALTIEFGSSGFDLDANSSSAPVSTGLFCVVIPLEGDDKNAEIEFIASTSVIASNRATAACRSWLAAVA